MLKWLFDISFDKILVMKKSSLNYFFTFCFILFFQIGFAQTNFTTGEVVTLSGNRIPGEIDYRVWDKNPKKIDFRNFGSDEIIAFSPEDIRGFSVANEVYVSARVESEVLSNGELDFSSRIETVVETVFLQALVKGEKSLFYLKNTNSKDNFYIKVNDEYVHLKYKKFKKEETVNGVNRVFAVENKAFHTQLENYLKDCPTIMKDLAFVRYNSQSLTRLFLEYAKCKGDRLDFYKTVEKVLTRFEILAGVSMSKLNFEALNRPNLTDVDYGSSTNPTFGISFDLIFPKNMKKWSLSNELLYAEYRFFGSNINQKSFNHIEKSETTFEIKQIKLNSMLQHSLFFNSVEWFVHGGASFGFIIDETKNEFIETEFFNSFRSENRVPFESDRLAEMSFLVGTGIRIGKISGTVRYENGNGMSDVPSISSKTHKIFFLIGYRL